MSEARYKLIDEAAASLEEVISSLVEQKSGTTWAAKTNNYAIGYAQKLSQDYDGKWYKGFLSKELLLSVVLPNHYHGMTPDDQKRSPIVEDGTLVVDALKDVKNDNDNSKQCFELIEHLKANILESKFSSSLVLVVIDGKLKHVDGLHRMIAMASIIKDGHEYHPPHTYLLDALR